MSFEKIKNTLNIFNYRYPNISNLNAIVGENGSGKSSLISFIIEAYRAEVGNLKKYFKVPYIFIWHDNDEFYICKNLLEIKNNNHCVDLKDICLINYTNTFSFSEYKRNSNTVLRNIDKKLYNICFSNRLYEATSEDNLNNNQIIKAYHTAVADQIAAWQSVELPFKRPKLRLYFESEDKGAIDKLFEKVGNKCSSEHKGQLKKTLEDIFQFDKCKREHIVFRGILYSLLKWIFYNLTFHKDILFKKIIEIWFKLFIKYKTSLDRYSTEYICLFTDETFEQLNNLSGAYKTQKEAYKQVVNMLLDESFILDDGNNKLYFSGDNTHDNVSDFYRYYRDATLDINGFLDFEWDMSTGEFARFDLYAQLFKIGVLSNSNDENKVLRASSLLFIFDEIDLYLHPRWQQELINELLNSITKWFPNKKIQLIISSHSPIALSDIPNIHVVYMYKCNILDEKPQTFAANIYELYNRSFFFNQGKGFVIGEFAGKVMHEIISEWEKMARKRNLTEYEYRLIEKQKEVVDLIGEPLLRNYLSNMYNDMVRKKRVVFTEDELEVIKRYKQLSNSEKNKIDIKINI